MNDDNWQDLNKVRIGFGKMIRNKRTHFLLYGTEKSKYQFTERLIKMIQRQDIMEISARKILAGHGIVKKIFVTINQGVIADIGKRCPGGRKIHNLQVLLRIKKEERKRRARRSSFRSQASQVSAT